MVSDEKKQKNKKPNPKKRNNAKLSEIGRILNTVEEENKPLGKKKIKREKENNDDVSNAVQIKIQHNSSKAAKEKKKKKNKSKKKVRSEEQNSAPIDEFGEHGAEDGDEADTSNENLVGDASQVEKEMENSGPGGNVGKSKKAKKKKKKDHCSLKKHEELEEKSKEVDEDAVYLISSGDEDCLKGMNKWITEYHQSTPGLKVLQQRIDDFITAHEAKLEQERKEKEARAADGGWTVVVHHKGRKKTTDSESGIAVGSVAQAAVEDKMAKKKKNEVGLDFYRFQRREAKRNEIMMLQSKFEQDRKRIQQLRAARKFKPY